MLKCWSWNHPEGPATFKWPWRAAHINGVRSAERLSRCLETERSETGAVKGSLWQSVIQWIGEFQESLGSMAKPQSQTTSSHGHNNLFNQFWTAKLVLPFHFHRELMPHSNPKPSRTPKTIKKQWWYPMISHDYHPSRITCNNASKTAAFEVSVLNVCIGLTVTVRANWYCLNTCIPERIASDK